MCYTLMQHVCLQHYSRGDAWKVEEGAAEALSRLRAEGGELAYNQSSTEQGLGAVSFLFSL
jgi:hypothetical protein